MPNTEPDIAGYKIYFGFESGRYHDMLNVGLAASFVLKNLVLGVTYYICMTAYDHSGNESKYSGEVILTVK